MSELSPAAQAVLDAYNREARPEPHHQYEAIAAALRAAAGAVEIDRYTYEHAQFWSALLDIALELEGGAQ